MPIFKAAIVDESGIRRAVMRISHEITEANKGIEDVVIIGIRRRGVSLAKMICENLEKIEGTRPPIAELDITFYRDDLEKVADTPVSQKPAFPFDVSGKKVVLVDDVMYTGRTARAAIEAVFSVGRPAKIQLAILVDRGHRELPIRADYVGKTIPTSKNELVKVCTPDYDDGKLGVELYEK